MCYRRVIGSLNLLNQAHQQHVRLVRRPVVIQMVFCLCAHIIVGRLQSIQQLCQLIMHFGREDRHLSGCWEFFKVVMEGFSARDVEFA